MRYLVPGPPPCPEVAAVFYIRQAEVPTLVSVKGDAQVERQNTVVGFLTHQLCYINSLLVSPDRLTMTNSMICSIKPAFDHFGALLTVHSSSKPHLSDLVTSPVLSTSTTLRIRLFGSTPLWQHPAKYSSSWVCQFLTNIISYWLQAFELWKLPDDMHVTSRDISSQPYIPCTTDTNVRPDHCLDVCQPWRHLSGLQFGYHPRCLSVPWFFWWSMYIL